MFYISFRATRITLNVEIYMMLPFNCIANIDFSSTAVNINLILLT